jgi:hypothetical protein
MATHTFIELHLDETKYLADLNGMMIDLQNTIDFCNDLQKLYRAGNYGVTLVDALSTAILVRYCRSFVSGVRLNIKHDEVKTLSSEEIDAHKIYMSLRNKHIAHSVNDLEENKVVAYYIEERPEEGFNGISVQHGRVISLSSQDLDTIVSLCGKFIEYIDAEMKVEKTKILQQVNQLSMDTVLSWGMGGGFKPNMEDIHKRRRQ